MVSSTSGQTLPKKNNSKHLIIFILEYAGLQPIPDCGITYSLQSHFALEDALHLIPENVLISGDDRIPGVSEVGADSGLSFGFQIKGTTA